MPLQITDLFDEVSDSKADIVVVDVLSEAAESSSEISEQISKAYRKYKKLLNLPNMYTSLYLTDMAKEYTTTMNYNIFAGELKHK